VQQILYKSINLCETLNDLFSFVHFTNSFRPEGTIVNKSGCILPNDMPCDAYLA